MTADLSRATPRPWAVVEPVALDYRATLIYDAAHHSLIAQACGGRLSTGDESMNADVIPAKDLRAGDTLAPDGTRVLNVRPDGVSVFVKLKVPRCRATWYVLDQNWLLMRLKADAP